MPQLIGRCSLQRLLLTLCFVAFDARALAQSGDQLVAPTLGYSAIGRTAVADTSPRDEAGSTVTRAAIDERLATSPPDALRYEPGVGVQQTAHGQASPIVRGLTGQQVVHLFDGIRLNNSIYRQGPNQYLFNLDSETIAAITVMRGSSSVLHGSDALGGAILVQPISPSIVNTETGVALRPEVHARLGTADISGGGRVALRGQLGSHTAFILGGGYFDAARLESAGTVKNAGHDAPLVPRFERDGRTQLGTGYRQATFDARVVHQLTDTLQLTGALYGYRQYDAPRTDKCPTPGNPVGDCLTLDQQFRSLTYVSIRGDATTDLRDLHTAFSFQQGHERRRDTRMSAATEQIQNDDVATFGTTASAKSRVITLGSSSQLELGYGVDAYLDWINSDASTTHTDTGVVDVRSRGQYLAGSRYLTSGVHADAGLHLGENLELRAGLRVALAQAHAPADAESGSRGIDRTFSALVGSTGITWNVSMPLSLSLNVAQGFRAPNLDDLTARQSVGAGFQIENPDLKPERALSTELGAAWNHHLITIDGWLYWTRLQEAILRTPRDVTDCPIDIPECMTASSQLQLVNADASANLLGAESRVSLRLPGSITVRGTFAYTFGEGPGDVPLSRIPPMNGTVELQHHHVSSGIYAAFATRWAAAQTRLAPTDATDPRIPPGGTPAYAVVELRAGYRIDDRMRISASIDNLFDTAYRVHGSSINGAGRNLKLSISTYW